MSVDGFIDDATPQRLLVSNDEDFDRVDAVRATADAILVGANTIRRDDPRVYCLSSVAPQLETTPGDSATVVPVGATLELVHVLADLGWRSVERLMVEGGTTVLTQFLSAGLAGELLLSVCPFFVGDAGAPRFVGPGVFPWNKDHRMSLAEVRQMGDVVLLRYLLDRESRAS